MNSKKKIALIGAGNVMFKDEGIGIYAQKFLELNYDIDNEVTIVDGGVLGFQLMVYYQEYDYVIILDTITMENDTSGSIYNIPSEHLLGLGSYKQNAHEVEIVEMLEICSLLDKMADVRIIGIVPEDIISVDYGITNKLKDKFELFINEAIKELNALDIKVEKKDNKSLEDIIKLYSHPMADRELEHLK